MVLMPRCCTTDEVTHYGSMGLVYLPTFTVNLSQMLSKHSIDGAFKVQLTVDLDSQDVLR